MSSKVNGRPERQARLEKAALNLQELRAEATSDGDDFLAYVIDLAVKETQNLIQSIAVPK